MEVLRSLLLLPGTWPAWKNFNQGEVYEVTSLGLFSLEPFWYQAKGCSVNCLLIRLILIIPWKLLCKLNSHYAVTMLLESVYSVHFWKEIFFILRVTVGAWLKSNTSQETSCCVQFPSFQHNYVNPPLTLEKGQWQYLANVIQFSLIAILGIHRAYV